MLIPGFEPRSHGVTVVQGSQRIAARYLYIYTVSFRAKYQVIYDDYREMVYLRCYLIKL